VSAREGQIPQDAKKEQSDASDPEPNRLYDQAKGITLEFANEVKTPSHDGDWKAKNQQRVKPDRLGQVAVQQLVHRSQRAASGAEQTRGLIESAPWIKAKLAGIEEIKYAKARRPNGGQHHHTVRDGLARLDLGDARRNRVNTIAAGGFCFHINHCIPQFPINERRF
jgi:hypothetical protein